MNLTEFDQVFSQYLKLTSKTLQEASNDVLFDFARIALKNTDKAKPETIRGKLNEASNKYPDRTLGQMIAITKNKNNPEFNLNEEVDKLKRMRVGHSGRCKSGWIEPMVQLLPFIKSKRISANGVPSGLRGKGGAEPIKYPASVMHGSVFNDTEGGTNGERMKQEGAQKAVDIVTADKIAYIMKKMEPALTLFNKK